MLSAEADWSKNYLQLYSSTRACGLVWSPQGLQVRLLEHSTRVVCGGWRSAGGSPAPPHLWLETLGARHFEHEALPVAGAGHPAGPVVAGANSSSVPQHLPEPCLVALAPPPAALAVPGGGHTVMPAQGRQSAVHTAILAEASAGQPRHLLASGPGLSTQGGGGAAPGPGAHLLSPARPRPPPQPP